MRPINKALLTSIILTLVSCGGDGDAADVEDAAALTPTNSNSSSTVNCYYDLETGVNLGPVEDSVALERAKESAGVIILVCVGDATNYADNSTVTNPQPTLVE